MCNDTLTADTETDSMINNNSVISRCDLSKTREENKINFNNIVMSAEKMRVDRFE